MPLKQLAIDKPIFSQSRIAALNELLKQKVAKEQRLQKSEKPSRHEVIPAFRIRTKHIVLLLDKSTRTAERIMQLLREQKYISRNQYLTIEVFCRATGLNEELVQLVMNRIVKRTN